MLCISRRLNMPRGRLQVLLLYGMSFVSLIFLFGVLSDDFKLDNGYWVEVRRSLEDRMVGKHLQMNSPGQKTGQSVVLLTVKRLGCPFFPRGVQDLHYIMDQESIATLRTFSGKFTPGRIVTVLLSNEQSLSILVNWLCVATKKMVNLTENLLIVVPHENSSMAENLSRKGINAVQMRFNQFCLNNTLLSRGNSLFKTALIARLASVMLLTEWGFDVAVYDPDAMIIKDPTPMYNSLTAVYGAHIIAQKGSFPTDIYEKWGFTLVMGAVLYRSVPELKLLWQKMAEAQYSSVDIDDQRITNMGVLLSHIKWEKVPMYDSDLGTGANGLSVIALGRRYSLRGWPVGDNTDNLYILHALLGHVVEEKIGKLVKANLWHLVGEPLEGFSSPAIYEDPNEWLNQLCQ